MINDDVLDAALGEISASASAVVALAGEPADFVAADAGRLASASVAAGDFSVRDGLISGRRVTVAAQAGVPASAAGQADTIALLDEAGQRLLFVSACPAADIAVGDTVDFAAWDIELSDPA
ncbi:MAG: hypothetical protein WA906_02260 [Pacificimonas sp.]